MPLVAIIAKLHHVNIKIINSTEFLLTSLIIIVILYLQGVNHAEF
jgi:hypothetical protein